jgi:hypothetical protein
VGAEYVLYAAANLLLATDDTTFSDLLQSGTKYADALTHEMNNAHWQNDQTFGLLVFASNPNKFPASGVGRDAALGWGAACKAKYVEQADLWLARQAENPYRKVWYTPNHGYFKLMGWGSNGFRSVVLLACIVRFLGCLCCYPRQSASFCSGMLLLHVDISTVVACMCVYIVSTVRVGTVRVGTVRVGIFSSCY